MPRLPSFSDGNSAILRKLVDTALRDYRNVAMMEYDHVDGSFRKSQWVKELENSPD